MGSRFKNHLVSRILVIIACGLGGTLVACAPTSGLPAGGTSSTPPQVTFVVAPTSLCQIATQVRFVPQVTGPWADDVTVHWELSAENDATLLNQGEWQPAMKELVVPFPNNTALPPGRYRLTLRMGNEPAVAHTFTIDEDAAAITAFSLAMTPTGPAVEQLDAGVRHFYLRYTYANACLGTPYWVAVRHHGELICTHDATLPQTSGVEAIPCYRKDGAVLEDGVYEAELTMLGHVYHRDTFAVGAAPTPLPPTPTSTVAPTATPTPLPLVCTPLFAAAGLTPEGEPYLPKDSFEWYSQALYVGTRCENLSSNTSWKSAWYRNGQLVREASGAWAGVGGAGTVWDSITGVPRAPFLPGGTYTVSLTLEGSTPLTTTFRLIPYVKP
ncbi:MAG TPA: hypothetical protein PLH19_01245 [Anaerolineae bacterium]|nr:hypothetical protein [Anaerolineae bacterium]HQH37147.1 hypothetical protein [Anaerolineae bacterium]